MFLLCEQLPEPLVRSALGVLLLSGSVASAQNGSSAGALGPQYGTFVIRNATVVRPRWVNALPRIRARLKSPPFM